MNVVLMKFFALILGFALWGALGYFGKVPLEPLIALLQMGLGGLITHMLQADVPGAASVPPVPLGKALDSTQAGFALTRLLLMLAAIALGLAVLSGCTTTTASIYRGYATEVKAGIQTWDDNAIATLRDVFCAQPYSAIQRHPEMQTGVQALCGPLANVSSLDANQLTMLMGILQSSGVKLQAVPK